MRKWGLAVVAALTAFFTAPAMAGTGPELVKNGSFEINNLADYGHDWDWMSQSALEDWTLVPTGVNPNRKVNEYVTMVVAPGGAVDHGNHAPGDMDQSTSSNGTTYYHTNAVWGSDSYQSPDGYFPETSPNGGSFIQGDGASQWSAAIAQTITGLTVGAQYELTFYQAAGQQIKLSGPTSEWWDVTFGGTTLSSDAFHLESHGFGDWVQQTMTFTATDTTQILSFLAVGTPDAGGQPPMSFLDGVSLKQLGVGAVPEPATWATMLLGFGLVGAVARRRRPASAHA